MRSSARMFATLLAAQFTMSSAASMPGAAPAGSPSKVLQDPVQAISTDLAPGQSVLRIVQDYNNDGLPDIALASSESCGNKTCSFTVFLRLAGGGYVRAGEIGGLPWGYRIVPEKKGVARWETCAASGQQVSFYSMRISGTGVVAGPSRTLRGNEASRACKWADRFTWQECDAEHYLRTGACEWTTKTWP